MKRTLAEWIARLTKGYIKYTGKKPDGLAKLKIKMEAAQKVRNQKKVVKGNFNPGERWWEARPPKEGGITTIHHLRDPLKKYRDRIRPGSLLEDQAKTDPYAVKTNIVWSDFTTAHINSISKNKNKINYKEMEDILETKLKGNETWDDLKTIRDRKFSIPEPEDMASGGIARVGMAGGKLVKGGAWVINKLKEQLSQLKKEDFMGKLSNLSSTRKALYMNELETLIKQLERGGKIPDDMLQTMRQDKRFKDIVKTPSTDPELRELEEVLLGKTDVDRMRDIEQKINLEEFDVTGKTKHASGGIAGQLHLYDGGRARFDKGGMDRRGFLKLMAGLAALPVVGKFFKLAKPAAKVAETFEHVPIKDIPGMPAGFKPLVARVVKEGTDVTKQFGTVEREIVHATELPTSGTKVLVTQQLDTGDVLVDIGLGKHGWPAGRYGQPARLEYKAAEDIMTGPSDEPFKSGRKRDPYLEIKTEVHEDLLGSGLKGDPKNLHLKPGKTKEEFWVDEAEFTGGHPENVKFEESVGFKYGDHGSDFGEVERFATGKKNIDKKIVGKQADRDAWAEGHAEAQAEAQAVDDFDPEFSKGGRASYTKGGLAHVLGV